MQSSNHRAGAPAMYMGLSGEGSELEDQRSLPRKGFMIAVALVYVLSVPLLWSATALADSGSGSGDAPAAVVSKGSNSGPGSGGDEQQRARERRR